MTRTTKAILLSALVLPGAGQIYLKKHIPGAIFAIAALASVGFIVARAVQRATDIVDQILRGEVPPDVATVTELVTKQTAGTEATLSNIALTVLVISWLVSIAHAYRAGRSQCKGDAIRG